MGMGKSNRLLLAISLFTLIVGCGWRDHWPNERYYPAIEPYIAGGAVVDGAMQIAKIHPIIRGGVILIGGVTYRVIDRGEAQHFGIALGGLLAEIVGVALRGHP